MAETGTGTRITHAATVVVPVTDQDAAIEFYVDTLGFETRSDFNYDDGTRWVEVAPPGAATSVALIAARADGDAGIETRVALSTKDIEADHAYLRARGVDVDEEILRPGDPVVYWGGAALAGTPPMFLFRDRDGNSFLLVQGP